MNQRVGLQWTEPCWNRGHGEQLEGVIGHLKSVPLPNALHLGRCLPKQLSRHSQQPEVPGNEETWAAALGQ